MDGFRIAQVNLGKSSREEQSKTWLGRCFSGAPSAPLDKEYRREAFRWIALDSHPCNPHTKIHCHRLKLKSILPLPSLLRHLQTEGSSA
jgi:hypothetical protein